MNCQLLARSSAAPSLGSRFLVVGVHGAREALSTVLMSRWAMIGSCAACPMFDEALISLGEEQIMNCTERRS